MSEAELKLECLKLAAQLDSGASAVELARRIYQWMKEDGPEGQ
jgi:hypothetical protein